MRFSSATLLLSSVSVLSTNVFAAPLRIVVVEKISGDKDINKDIEEFLRSTRIGHAGAASVPGFGSDPNEHLSAIPGMMIHEEDLLPGAHPAPRPAYVGPDDGGLPMTPDQEYNIPIFHDFPPMDEGAACRDDSSIRVKMDKLKDHLREMMGMSAIPRTPLCSTVHTEKIVPGTIVPTRMPCHSSARPPTASVNEFHIIPVMRRPPMHSGGTVTFQRMRPKSFSERVQRALYALSPWEGRALAFVVGCGLGVLLRMIYVFIVLGIRMWRSKRKNADGFIELPTEEDGDEIVGVVLFDAASIKGASVEDLPSYQEKL
jgi:hypothetical protein